MQKNKFIIPTVLFISILVSWQIVSILGIVPDFLLPSPEKILTALINDRQLLFKHLQTTLLESIIGLSISMAIALVLAFIMDKYHFLQQLIYPIIVLLQTIPIIAIAPLLILWFGYDLTPKIILIVIMCSFPITITVFEALKNIDQDYIKLFQTWNVTEFQMMKHLKFPLVLPAFFAGAKVATSYAIIGAVIAEWLGGESGLGVYMTRVRKSYSFDKMFAAIVIISVISLLSVYLLQIIEKKVLRYRNIQNH